MRRKKPLAPSSGGANPLESLPTVKDVRARLDDLRCEVTQLEVLLGALEAISGEPQYHPDPEPAAPLGVDPF